MKSIYNACIHNLHAYWSSLAASLNGSIIHENNTLITISKMNSGIFNAIFDFNLNEYEKIKETIFAENKIPKLPISFWVNSETHQKENNFLAKKGLEYFGHVPIMYIHTNTEIDTKLPDSISIVPYENDSLAAFMVPLSQSFSLEPDVSQMLQHALEINKDHLHHFVAIHHKKIVATGSIFTGSEIPGFYNLAVLPEYRNNSLASAMHQARIQFVKKLGYEYATLQATPMATNLNRRLGFKTVAEYDIYLDYI